MTESVIVHPPLIGWTTGKRKQYFEDYGHDLAVKAIKSYRDEFHTLMHEVVPFGDRVIHPGNGWWWTKSEYLDQLVEKLGHNVTKVTFRRTK